MSKGSSRPRSGDITCGRGQVVSAAPKTCEDLYRFYDTYVKPLYCAVQAHNVLPVEVVFEINAAFDHLSRITIYAEPEEAAVAKAAAHLKRGCLDIFKLQVKDTVNNYQKLQEIDTSIIDNGQFDSRMHAMIREIRSKAREARRSEGKTHHGEMDLTQRGEISLAFHLWQEVYSLCETFDSEIFGSAHVPWAKKKGFKVGLRTFLTSIGATAVVAAFVEEPLAAILEAAASWLCGLLP